MDRVIDDGVIDDSCCSVLYEDMASKFMLFF